MLIHEIHVFKLWIETNFQCMILEVNSSYLSSSEKGLNETGTLTSTKSVQCSPAQAFFVTTLVVPITARNIH